MVGSQIMDKNLSEKIKELMAKHGIASITELARRSKIPQPTLYKLVSGETKTPRQSLLEKISNYFKVAPASLLSELSDDNNTKFPVKILISSKLIDTQENFSFTGNTHADFVVLVADDSFFPLFQSGTYLFMEKIHNRLLHEGMYILYNFNGSIGIYLININNNIYYAHDASRPINQPLILNRTEFDSILGYVSEARRFLKKGIREN